MNMKITIGINSLVSTMHSAYGNHLQTFYNLGRKYSDIDFILNNPARMSIDRMRNMTAEVALQSESDYILFIDDDVLIPISDGHQWLRKLIDCHADIVAGDVLIRSYPFDHMIFKYVEVESAIAQDDMGRGRSARSQLQPLSKLEAKPFEVDAVGFSCCLIDAEILKQIPKPYFVTTPNHSTEDIYFCLKAKEAIKDLRIMCDPTIICGHILWEEVITTGNREAYNTYLESMYPMDGKINIDRGKEYYNKIKETLNNANG
jgi:hypothetical protein